MVDFVASAVGQLVGTNIGSNFMCSKWVLGSLVFLWQLNDSHEIWMIVTSIFKVSSQKVEILMMVSTNQVLISASKISAKTGYLGPF